MTSVLLLNQILAKSSADSAFNKALISDDIKTYIDEYLESPKSIFKKKFVYSHAISNAAIQFWTKKIMSLLETTRDNYSKDSLMYELWDYRFESEKIMIEINQPFVNSHGHFIQFCIRYPITAASYLKWLSTVYQKIYSRSIQPELDYELLSNSNNNISLACSYDDFYPYE